jgi:signal transduction histidine kinase
MNVNSTLKQYRSSFQLRIFLALVAMIAIFIPGTGYVGYLQLRGVAEKQIEQFTVTTASQVAKQVHFFLNQQSDNVSLLASFFAHQLIDPSNHPELLKYFQLFKKDHPEFVNIYYGDKQGRFIMVPPQRPEVQKTFDPRTRPWYQGAAVIKTGETYWTDVYTFASAQKPGLTVSAPVYDDQQQLQGVCGIDIDLVAFSAFLTGIDIGNNGIAYIFDNKSSQFIAYPGMTRLNGGPDQLQILGQSRQQLRERQQQFGKTYHHSGQYFTAFTSYPGKDWTVGVTVSTTEHLTKIQIIKKSTITLVIAALLLASLFSYLLSKNIIRPLLKLQKGIDRIGRGDFSHRVEVTDPDIARDLAGSFNTMAQSLHNSLNELKVTYAELQEKQKLALVGSMTAGIAHEIKNPLGIILGAAQVVTDQQRPWEMREKAAGFIMDEVVRLDTTLKAFLAFAKPATPVLVEVDVPRLFAETISAVEQRYLEEGYQIERNFVAAAPPVEADPGQLRQILMNILLNSFAAMPEGGRVMIRIRVEKEPDIAGENKRFISIRNPFTVDRDWLIVSITDEGCGIPEDQLEKIMDPFVSFSDDGVGLGLSIVSQLVKLHRGQIQIESSKGRGTSFHIYFPCILKEPVKDVEPAAY